MRVLHRSLGLIGALFLTLLTVTGLALQHTQALGLDTAYVESDWLLDWYGVAAPDATAFTTGDHRVARVGERVLLNGELLDLEAFDLRGVAAVNDEIVLLAPDELAIVTSSGELIERIPTSAAAMAIGVDSSPGRVYVRTAMGEFVFDAALAHWDPTAAPASVAWSEPVDITANELQMLQALYRQHLITIERLLLDLHAGRMFGPYGTWIIDIAAVLLLALAVTGLLLSRRR